MEKTTENPAALNPFTIPRDNMSRTISVRLTPAEHATLLEIAKREDATIVGLVREGLGLLVESRRADRKRRKPN